MSTSIEGAERFDGFPSFVSLLLSDAPVGGRVDVTGNEAPNHTPQVGRVDCLSLHGSLRRIFAVAHRLLRRRLRLRLKAEGVYLFGPNGQPLAALD